MKYILLALRASELQLVKVVSWCISLYFSKIRFFFYIAYFYMKTAPATNTLKFFTLWELHQLWQAVILKPFKLEECTLHFWKPPIFIIIHSCQKESLPPLCNNSAGSWQLLVARMGLGEMLQNLKSY